MNTKILSWKNEHGEIEIEGGKNRLIYVGSGTVWHRKDTGYRCDTPTEEKLHNAVRFHFHNDNKSPEILQPHKKSKNEKAIKKAVIDICSKRKEKLGEYHVNEELFDKLTGVIDSYNGKISLAAALGILDLVKDRLKENYHDS